MEADDTAIPKKVVSQPDEHQQNVGEASVDPGLSLDALALDDEKDNKKTGGAFSNSAGHASDFSFILSIGSPDSVRSTITIDPTLRFDTNLLDQSELPSDIPIKLPQSTEGSNINASPRRRFRPPANAHRWMDDSEHPKSPNSRTSYNGMLGMSNHLVPIMDTDDDDDVDKSEHEYHNSNTSSFAELASNESSAFEAGSISTGDTFASEPYNDESPNDVRGLTLKMQQLRATAATNNAGTLADNDDENGATDFNPMSPNRSRYLDSLHSLNTLFSQDNIICNRSGHSTSTGSFGVED